MHHALEIQEILLNIFDFPSHQWQPRDTSTLAYLARTCRTFKEPALDLLWEELRIICPLARCIPGASHQLLGKYSYVFSRPLTQTEWDTLYGYTHRIRSITHLWQPPGTTSFKFPTTSPLFPNLRTLRCTYTKETMPLLHLPLPSLLFLEVNVDDPRLFQESLMSFLKFSPNIRELRLFVDQLDGSYGAVFTEPSYMYRWQNLTSVVCPQVALDTHELLHFSRTPALTKLAFTATTILTFDSRISFANLHDLRLRSESLEPISQLLFQIRLPAIRDLDAYFFNCPSRPQLSSFWAGLQTTATNHTIEELRLNHFVYPRIRVVPRSGAPLNILFGFEDLRPAMAFSNLRRVDVNLQWDVGLTGGDLLALTMAWCRLENLSINSGWGWGTSRGITPNGLVRVLEACRSLKIVALAIDARGYTESPRSQEGFGLTPLRPLYIWVLDSVTDAQSVPAMADLFSGIALRDKFYLDCWGGDSHSAHWVDVCRRVRGVVADQYS